MIQAELTEIVPAGRLNAESLGDAVMAVLGWLRPADGWIAVTLVALNLIVVVWSVDQANWVATPNLAGVLILGMAAGLILARVPLWGALVFPIGLAAGVLVVVWQMTSFMGGADAVTNAGELWDRLELWYSAAKAGSINIDQVPFAFAILAASWLYGYLAIWLLSRYRIFWIIFVLGSIGLISNLTYLPPSASLFMGMYLFTALLLVARVQSVRRREGWSRRNIRPDEHLGFLSLSDSFFLAAAVVIVAFWIPAGRTLGPAHGVYEYMRSPLEVWEDDFNRLFAGLPARRPLGYRIWGDVMAFQGTIRPTTAQVLFVESPVPMYWKARSYGTYTPKGWISEETTLQSLDWVPSFAAPETALGRVEVSYRVIPNYSSRSVFAGDRVLAVDRPVQVETYDSPVYALDIKYPDGANNLPPLLTESAQQLNQITRLQGPFLEDATLAAGLPPELRLLEVERLDGEAVGVMVAEVLSVRPDVLSVRSVGGKVRAGDDYQVTSSVSVATPQVLRRAGTAYPAWALSKYTQLPPGLPQRVRDLGAQLTAEVVSPFDKAKAIESYLRNFNYTLDVEPPPFDADGVDHFLFTLQGGYSEYFASSMTVLLRSVGVPARLATGYTAGDKQPDQDLYVVTDSHSHAWVEVFFPRYGWIGFEPTPGKAIPDSTLPLIAEESSESSATDAVDPLDEACFDDFEVCEQAGDFPVGGSSSASDGIRLRILAILPWLLGIFGAAALAAIVATLLWRRYMSPSEDPGTVYRRLTMLGALGAIGPKAHQTPFQYRERLSTALPQHRDDVNMLVDVYVRTKYGAKELRYPQRRSLVDAWLRLRMPLLLQVFRRWDR